MTLDERNAIESYRNRLRGMTGGLDVIGKIGQHLSNETIDNDDFIIRMMQLEADAERDGRHIRIDTLEKLAAICRVAGNEDDFVEMIFSGEVDLQISQSLQAFYEMGSQLWTEIPELTSKFRYRTNPVKSKDGKLSLVKLDWNTPDRSSKHIEL